MMSGKQGNPSRLSYCSKIVNSAWCLPFPSSLSNWFAFPDVFESFGFINREEGGVLLEKRWKKGKSPERLEWHLVLTESLELALSPLWRRKLGILWNSGTSRVERVSERVWPRAEQQATLQTSAHYSKRQWLWKNPEVVLSMGTGILWLAVAEPFRR